ncbi:MAG: GatB/YqeY domain-containing protein [Anaerolineae bacterium]
MTLKEKLAADLRQAMLTQDETRKSALRLLRSSIVYAEKERGHPLDDAEVQAVALKEARLRRESIEAFRAGGRDDLVGEQEAQLAVLQAYLPQQMARAEVEQAAREAIAATGATGPGDMGAVMRELMPRLKGRADGQLVHQVVRELLGGR